MQRRSDPPRARTRPAARAIPEPAPWRESLPFFVGGGVALGLAAVLIVFHSPAAIARLPLWTFLIAIGSIALVGGTVATFVADPIPDLPVENELVGSDLIVVSRARWKDLNKMERWVEDRLVPLPEATPAPVARAPLPPPRRAPPVPRTRSRPRTGIRSVPDPAVPTLDELLADLPMVSDEELARAELWRETDDSRELPPRPAVAFPPVPPRTSGNPSSSVAPPSVALPSRARPSTRTAVPPPVAPAPPAPPRAVDEDLERLLRDLEREAAKAVEAREVEVALAPTGVLECAGCGRGVDLTERWEHCDECLSAYCARCEDRIVPVGGRNLCANCRARGRRSRL